MWPAQEKLPPPLRVERGAREDRGPCPPHGPMVGRAGEGRQAQRPQWSLVPVSSDAHGMDLFAVAVHEFGHAIGLGHVAAPRSVMQPYYHGPVGDPLHYGLPYEDRVRVWQLYGKSSPQPARWPEDGAPAHRVPREGFLYLFTPHAQRLVPCLAHTAHVRAANTQLLWAGGPDLPQSLRPKQDFTSNPQAVSGVTAGIHGVPGPAQLLCVNL